MVLIVGCAGQAPNLPSVKISEQCNGILKRVTYPVITDAESDKPKIVIRKFRDKLDLANGRIEDGKVCWHNTVTDYSNWPNSQ